MKTKHYRTSRDPVERAGGFGLGRVRGRRGAGRPHWPVVMLVKCVMLAKWFNLSDPQLEDELRDRLSFRRFVGLSLEDDTPDETTFVVFRSPRRLAKRNGNRRGQGGVRGQRIHGQGPQGASEGAGVHCGIVERRVRGQKELTDEQKEHNRLSAAVRAVVEHPFAWIKNMG